MTRTRRPGLTYDHPAMGLPPTAQPHDDAGRRTHTDDGARLTYGPTGDIASVRRGQQHHRLPLRRSGAPHRQAPGRQVQRRLHRGRRGHRQGISSPRSPSTIICWAPWSTTRSSRSWPMHAAACSLRPSLSTGPSPLATARPTPALPMRSTTSAGGSMPIWAGYAWASATTAPRSGVLPLPTRCSWPSPGAAWTVPTSATSTATPATTPLSFVDPEGTRGAGGRPLQHQRLLRVADAPRFSGSNPSRDPGPPMRCANPMVQSSVPSCKWTCSSG